MKINIGDSSIEISVGDIANIIIMKRLHDLDLRVSQLEKSMGDSQTPAKRDSALQNVGIKSPSPKPKKQKRSFYWTKQRMDILQENFFKKTVEELMDLLPGASKEQILQQAEYSGMVLKKTGEKNVA